MAGDLVSTNVRADALIPGEKILASVESVSVGEHTTVVRVCFNASAGAFTSVSIPNDNVVTTVS